MIGAEATPLDGDPDLTYYKLSDQFHPATLHWQMPNGNIGWMRLKYIGAINAHASKNQLAITGKTEPKLAERYGDAHKQFVFQFHIPGGTATIQSDTWILPGLSVKITGNLSNPEIQQDGDFVMIVYTLPDARPYMKLDIQQVS
jgi:hypothetical protein